MSNASTLPPTADHFREGALQLGPRKKACVTSGPPRLVLICLEIKSCTSDPLVSYGRHFGRTVYALCDVHKLLTNGILGLRSPSEEPLSSTPGYVYGASFWTAFVNWSLKQRREHGVFKVLLQIIPSLETRLIDGSDDDVGTIAKMVCHGFFFSHYA